MYKPCICTAKTENMRDFVRFLHKNGDFPAKNVFLFDKNRFFSIFSIFFKKLLHFIKVNVIIRL